jgi:hypothetical protein
VTRLIHISVVGRGFQISDDSTKHAWGMGPLSPEKSTLESILVRNSVRKKVLEEHSVFSNCHIIVFLVSGPRPAG